MEVSRRSFVRSMGIGAAGALVFSAYGCTTPEVTPGPQTPTDLPPQKATEPTDGIYVTRGLGHESWIYVSTTLRDGAIAACRVIRDNETIGIGNYACARIPAAIVKHQSINVPSVRGCSISSNAIKAAVKEALELACYDVEKFSKEVTPEAVSGKFEETCDVVIIGAGTAGLVAGARLAEKGLKVLLVEKKDIPGGSMAMTYGGIVTAGSRRQFAYDVTGQLQTTSGGNIDLKVEELKKQIIDPSRPEGMTFCKVLYTKAGEMADWLSDVGVGFRTMGTFEGATSIGNGISAAPGMYMGGVGYIAMFLAERIEKFPGCKIMYSTTVNGLIKDENGKYVGVTATGNNGGEYTITAKAVCLAGGGFARNKDMVAKYYPNHAGQFFNCASGSTGEVIQMGIDAGGVFESLGNGELPAYLSSKSLVELAFIGMTAPGLFVNTKGVELGNCVSHANNAKVKLDKENGDRFFIAFDETSAELVKDNVSFGFDTYNVLFERGEVMHFDTVEAAAEELDLPELKNTLENNNRCALSGEADAFGRKNLPFIDTRNGLFVVEVTPTFYLTTDGLRIDEECHLLDADSKPIAGLYAAGDVAGAVEKKDGLKYSYGFDSAASFGFQMADVLAKEINA